MKEGFRQSMAWMHTWLVLPVGWVLYFIYLTGTLGYVDREIDYWMTPEKAFFSTRPDPAEQLTLAQNHLTRVATDATRWNIQLQAGREAQWLEVGWMPPAADGARPLPTQRETLDPDSGEPFDNSARATGGGQLLYRMHYSLAYMPLNTAIMIVMFCSMLMFAGMLTGIIAHKKIFADFFTFRPGRGQRSWLDMHNLLSVGSLPFHLIVTYSGLLFFVYLVLPAVPDLVFEPSASQSVQQQVYGGPPDLHGPDIPAASGEKATLTTLAPLLLQVDALWGTGKVATVEVRNPGDANARVLVKPLPDVSVVIPTNGLLFDGVSGELLSPFVEPYPFGPVDQVLKGIHRGLFARPFMRVLYLFMGAVGTAMIATGLLLWSNKRKQRLAAKGLGPHPGIRLVDTLNLGTIVGLPIAIAAYFWANRLLPASLATRADWEVHAMYLTLAAVLLYACVRSHARAWTELLWLTAAAIGLLPLVNALTTQRHLGVSLAQGDWLMAGFDLSALCLGLCVAGVAWRLQQLRSRRGTSLAASAA